MTDLRGLQLEVDEHDMLMHPHVGGVILFTRNYESLEQITTLCKSIHDLREPHLLIAVDHEGGRVQRFLLLHRRSKSAYRRNVCLCWSLSPPIFSHHPSKTLHTNCHDWLNT